MQISNYHKNIKDFYILKKDLLFWSGSCWCNQANLAKRYDSLNDAREIQRMIKSLGSDADIMKISLTLSVSSIPDDYKESTVALDNMANTDKCKIYLNKLNGGVDLVGSCDVPQDFMHIDNITKIIKDYGNSIGVNSGIIRITRSSINNNVVATASGFDSIGYFTITGCDSII